MSYPFAIRDLRIAYGALTALDVRSLDIEPGEAVALVGPSGAGKTTLLRSMAASLRTSPGAVAVNGRAVDGLSSRELRALRSRIGFVHQDLRLIPNLRVIQNVAAGRFGRRTLARSIRSVLSTSRADAAEIYEILERVGIEEKLYERVDRLSGGQQQRVAIARALFQEPEVLMADEPVASVDPERARATVGLLVSLAREQRLTLCVSLHNIEIAREMFPRIVGLRQGRIVFDAAPSDIDDERIADLYRIEASETPKRNGRGDGG